MTFVSRLALASLIVVVDIVAFAIPLAALFAAYVIVARPAFFLQRVVQLYDDGRTPAGG